MTQLREYRGCTRVNSINGAHEFTKGKLERHTGGLEGCGSEQSAGDPRYRCATLTSNRENPHAPSSNMFQAPGPGHEDPGESNDTPQASGEAKVRWRPRISTGVTIKPNHSYALKTVS